MKDRLGRDIMVGDTLAVATSDPNRAVYPLPELQLLKVAATSSFAVQAEVLGEGTKEPKYWVISDTSRFVICDWAKGSDAA